MEDHDSASEKIRTEIKGDLSEVRNDFLKHFNQDSEHFIDLMTHAFLRWSELDAIAGEDENKGYISGFVFSAITQHIISLRLFLSGYIVAAGNTQRQVLETMALALVCSCKELHVLERFMKDQYSTNNAIRDALRHSEQLNVKEDALKVLGESRDFYHMYSHPTHATLASHIRFSDEGALYIGASFDEGKIEQYTKEVKERIGLATVFENFVQGVIQNVRDW